MYSLYPNRITGFLWQVDRHNLTLANVEAFSVDTDFTFEDPSPVPSESESCQSDSFLSVSESDTFFFPFSLRVSRLLGFLRGECTVESPLLADSSSDWSNRPNRSFDPLNRNEIGLSSRVGKHLSLTNIIVKTRSRRQVQGCGFIKQNIVAHVSLFGSRVITLITLLFV